jgi:hypothetical protein
MTLRDLIQRLLAVLIHPGEGRIDVL